MADSIWNKLQDSEAQIEDLSKGDIIYLQYGNSKPLETSFEILAEPERYPKSIQLESKKGYARSRTIRLDESSDRMCRFIDHRKKGCRVWLPKDDD